MEKKDVIFFKIIGVIICLVTLFIGFKYFAKDYKTHDQKIEEQSKELKNTMDNVDKAIKNGNVK